MYYPQHSIHVHSNDMHSNAQKNVDCESLFSIYKHMITKQLQMEHITIVIHSIAKILYCILFIYLPIYKDRTKKLVIFFRSRELQINYQT